MQPVQKDEQSSSRRLLPNAPKTCVSSGLPHSSSSHVPLSLICVMQLTALRQIVCIHAYSDSCTCNSFLSCSCFVSLASSISVCQPLPLSHSLPISLSSLQDHPDYEAPRLKTTWMQMLPRMLCGCVILVLIVGAMVGVVWSVVSDAPGDPLHRKGHFSSLSFSLSLFLSFSISLSRARSIFV